MVQAGFYVPKTVCPPEGAESLLKVWEERVRAKPHQKIKIKTKNSPIREARGAKV